MSILDRDGHACRQCGDRGRLEVDHIKPVRTHPALAYDPANLQALCPACHTRKTRLECGHPERSPEARDWARMVGQLEAGQTDAFSIPYQLRPSAVLVELIAGPPAAGKSTYAKAKAGADDVIIDLKDCLQAASGEAWTDDRDKWRTAFRARDKALRDLADRRSGRALFPVVTSGATVGWQATETGNVAGPSAFATADRPMKPDHNLGVQMRLTRKAMMQTGAVLEQAVRRDMNAAMAAELDRVAFLGTGADGQPLGVIAGAATYGITATDVDAVATWAAFRAAVAGFMVANAAPGPKSVRAMIRPELWQFLEGALWDAGSGMTQWDKIVASLGAENMTESPNGLAAPAGDPLACMSLLTTTTNGVAPFFIGAWGAVDSWSQTLPDWIGAHVRAFEFFGGAPALIVSDNLKSAVVRACFHEPGVNRSYTDLARHYQTAILPARPYKPKDKSKAEGGVLLVQRWIVARLRNRVFFSLEELNAAIREALTQLNARVSRHLGASRLELFERLDKPALIPLPPTRHAHADWRSVTVGADYHIRIDDHYYSVPYGLARAALWVRITASTVEAFQGGKRVASHQRAGPEGGRDTTVSVRTID